MQFYRHLMPVFDLRSSKKTKYGHRIDQLWGQLLLFSISILLYINNADELLNFQEKIGGIAGAHNQNTGVCSALKF